MGGEDVAGLLKLGAYLPEIVDFAIVGDGEFAVGGDHWLEAALEVDDREAAVAEADAWRGPHPAAVRAAMGERVGHGADPRRLDGLGNVGVEEACNAAH